MNQVNEFVSRLDKYVYTVAAVLSLLVPILSIFKKYDLLPFAFVVTILAQHNAFTYLTMSITNRAFPSVFTIQTATLLLLLSYASNACSMFGLKRQSSHWSNILKLVFSMMFMLIFIRLLWMLRLKRNSVTRYTAMEVYAISHLVIYCTIMTITGLTSSYFYFSWNDFNVTGVIIHSYSMFIYLALVYVIPPKLALARADAVLAASEQALETSAKSE